MIYSYYLIIVGDVIRQEWMNVGVMLYEKGGPILGCKINSARAKAVGLKHPNAYPAESYAEFYVQQYPTEASIEKMWDSIGGAMSCVQIRRGGLSIEEIAPDALLVKLMSDFVL